MQKSSVISLAKLNVVQKYTRPLFTKEMPFDPIDMQIISYMLRENLRILYGECAYISIHSANLLPWRGFFFYDWKVTGDDIFATATGIWL